MKKALSLILVSILLLLLGTSASANDEEIQILSELSDDELLAFLEEYNVSIPTQYEGRPECVPYIRYVIERVEQNPNTTFVCGYRFLHEFSLAIKDAVITYYGTSLISTYSCDTSTTNILQDNIVLDEWDPVYGDYNCYTYATNLFDYLTSTYPDYTATFNAWLSPGQIKWLVDGGEGIYGEVMYPNLAAMADAVVEDLEALGYTNVSRNNVAPLTSALITEHNCIICLRRYTDTSGDFHFMVFRENNVWQHKPGPSAPLQYLYTPSNDLPWNTESFINGIYKRDTDSRYESEIYYIRYTIPCTEFACEYLDNDTHALCCTVCGAHGTAIACTYSFAYCGGGAHVKTCTGCGNTKGFISPCFYVNGRCRTCGSIEPIIQQSLPVLDAEN